MDPQNRVDAAWPVNGQALCTAAGSQDGPAITSDGAGGALVAWSDGRGADYDVYAQRVLLSGAVDGAWPVDGLGLGIAAQNQWLPRLAADGSGGAMLVWQDYREPSAPDIYAHVLVSGAVDAPAPALLRGLAFAPPWPNPARESVALRVATPREGPAALTIYDVGGRRLRVMAAGSWPAGEQTWTWNLRDASGRGVAPGLYLAVLDVGPERMVRRVAVVK